ncbi:MAG: hypothetical protein K6D97_08325 [Clostridia bacterium]|nr:hypothetical protein [Clostridia bacterium]
MDYNSKANVHQVLTAITVKRLSAYAKLCELYGKLADIMVNEEGRAQVTPRDIEQRYSAILSSVAYNDLDESSYNKIIEEGYFSEKEVDIFKSFSAISKDFIDFTNGYNILKKAITKDSEDVDKDVVDDYLDFMENHAQNEHAKSFLEYIHVHSPTIIGKNYYNVYRKALKRIEAIDDSHLNIPQFSSSSHISKELFGPKTLTFNRNHKLRNRIFIDDSVVDQSRFIYTPKEIGKYTRSITPMEKLKEYGYSGKIVLSDAIQGTTLPARLLAAGLASILLVGGTAYGVGSSLSSRLTATEAHRQGVELDISGKTLDHLQSIENTISRLNNSPTAPDVNQLSELINGLDLANSEITQDLAASGFEKAHPDCVVTNVTTAYRDLSADERDLDITITYTDKDGKSHTFEVGEIDFDFNNSFNREDRFSTRFSSQINDLEEHGANADPAERDKYARKLLEDVTKTFNETNRFAALEAKYDDSTFLGGSKISANKRDSKPKDSNSIPTDKSDEDVKDF